MTESTAAKRWIVGLLAADSPAITNVYDDVAPDGAALPYVVLSYQGGADIERVKAEPAASELTFLVKVVDRSPSYSTIETLARRIDQLLHAGAASAIGGLYQVMGCWRVRPVQYPEREGDAFYVHLGGEYVVQMHRI